MATWAGKWESSVHELVKEIVLLSNRRVCGPRKHAGCCGVQITECGQWHGSAIEKSTTHNLEPLGRHGAWSRSRRSMNLGEQDERKGCICFCCNPLAFMPKLLFLLRRVGSAPGNDQHTLASPNSSSPPGDER